MLRVAELVLPNKVCVNFSLNPGEWVVLHGKNGAGKSLLLKALARLVSSDWKSFEYLGRPVTDWKPESYRSEVMYLASQVYSGSAETVGDFLSAPLAFSVHRAREITFDVLPFLGDLDPGAEFQKLSSGQRQFVNLLRALSLCPRILLLDEISANLDQERTRALEALLRSWSEKYGAAVIFVTHSPEQAKRLGAKVIEFDQLVSLAP